jgi:hypothetical protein
VCDCGCGEYEHLARLQMIEIEFALDESLRQTGVARRFLVRRQCYEPFVEELQARKLLQDYVYRFTRAQKTRWWTRLWRMRKIVRLQYVINVRNKGFDYARRTSIRSGILFVCSPRISNLLWKYWSWADRKRNETAPSNSNNNPELRVVPRP